MLARIAAAFADVTIAAAALLRRPGYGLTVIATLALGLGTVTATFALIQSVLLNPLPFPDADRLVLVRQQNPGGQWNTSVVDFQAIAGSSRTFEAVAAMRAGSALVGAGERAQWIDARWVTASFFDVLGTAPARGRAFRSGEDAPGAARGVVLGHAFAEREFAGVDPLGRTLLIDGQAHTVVGVMPAGLEALPAVRADLWPVLQLATPERRGPFLLSTVARLRTDATLSAAAEDLDQLSRELFPLWRPGFSDETARLVPLPLHDVVVGNAGDFLWVAFGAVVVVLLIALVNIANLMLMRITERAQDLGVRAALGASRWQLARLLMGESALLTLLGALCGVALAWGLLQAYAALGPVLPRLAEVRLDWRVIGFAAALALACAVVLGLLPVVLGIVGDVAGGLQRARGTSAGRPRSLLRSGLVVLQFALALPLLLATSLLLDSLARLGRVDPGFDAENVLVARIRLPDDIAADDAARVAFWQRALPELQGLPGVAAVGLADQLPPNCGCYNNFDIVGRPAAQGRQPQAPWIPASAGLFDALRLRLIDGRRFESQDTADAPPVVLVSRAFAERHFPGEPAVGKQLYEGGNTEQPVTIVGVVSDVKFDGLQGGDEAVYAPTSQGWGGASTYLVLRARTDSLGLVAPLRAALQRLDARLIPSEIDTLQQRLGSEFAGPRHWAVVIAGFAAAALVLAAVGVFGVLAFHIAQRQREFGICQALGADARRIAGMVLGRGLGCAALGLVLGSGIALLSSASLEALLFEVSSRDPGNWSIAAGTLLLVAALACWMPARRAMRISPAIALRQD